MPTNRRTLGRTTTNSAPVDKLQKSQKNAETYPSSSSNDRAGNGGELKYEEIVLVKHKQLPNLPTESTFLFEILIFVFSVFALGLQYVHVYKTVWWLPYSHSNYALNFYLIDPHLAVFCVVILSRRVMYILYRWFGRTRYGCLYWFSMLCRFGAVGCVVVTLFWSGFHAIKKQGLLYTSFLVYPFLMYLFLFGLKFKPFFVRTVWIQKPIAETTPGKNKEVWPDSLQHRCHIRNPDAVRHEVEIMKDDFNKRLKQVLFNSFFCTYYSGFLPICFTQKTIYYNVIWVWQHIALVWFTVFFLYFLHFLSSKYIDVLHCSALHLGKWSRVESKLVQGSVAWSELQIWQRGELVKHVRGHFKAECYINSAEPGNNMHVRFHFLFYQPLRVCHGLLGLASTLVVYLLVNLILATDWSQIISLSFLLFTAYYVLFKIMRDTLALRKTYRSEDRYEINVEN